MASVAATSKLVSVISPVSHCSLATPYAEAALSQWSQDNTLIAPQGSNVCQQKKWDEISTTATASCTVGAGTR